MPPGTATRYFFKLFFIRLHRYTMYIEKERSHDIEKLGSDDLRKGD